jgi:hypothetical protein
MNPQKISELKLQLSEGQMAALSVRLKEVAEQITGYQADAARDMAQSAQLRLVADQYNTLPCGKIQNN